MVERHPDIDVQRTAEEIQRYLAAHPDAAETLRGIVEWWLVEQRIEDAWHVVEKALALLEREGLVTRSALPGGSVLYSRAAESGGDEES